MKRADVKKMLEKTHPDEEMFTDRTDEMMEKLSEEKIKRIKENGLKKIRDAQTGEMQEDEFIRADIRKISKKRRVFPFAAAACLLAGIIAVPVMLNLNKIVPGDITDNSCSDKNTASTDVTEQAELLSFEELSSRNEESRFYEFNRDTNEYEQVNLYYEYDTEINSWSVESAAYELAEHLAEKYALESWRDGLELLKKCGYDIYLTTDRNVQAHLDGTFADWTYFPESLSDAYEYSDEERMINGAFVVMDYYGHILGVEGGIGKKTNFGCNAAYDTSRSQGSLLKQLAVYGYALENDIITYSSLIADKPLAPGVADTDVWPMNYDGYPSGGIYPAFYSFMRSINAVPAKLIYNNGNNLLSEIMNFSTERLHLQIDKEADLNYDAFVLGYTKSGPSIVNFANAYMPYGNGGKYYKASIISKCVDPVSGKVIIDNENCEGEQAVSEDTAYIMNKLLQMTVSEGNSTSAQIGGVSLAATSGKDESGKSFEFVGLTPDTVSVLWAGYPIGQNTRAIDNANSARIWKNVYGSYVRENTSDASFPETDNVVYARYCSETGLCANENCPGDKYGWYKKSNCPYCNEH